MLKDTSWAKRHAERGTALALVGGTEALDPFDQSGNNDPKKRAAWSLVGGDAAMLGALIGTKPIRDLARDFGVSDVAIHKACERLGVQKPGRGHWLKKAG